MISPLTASIPSYARTIDAYRVSNRHDIENRISDPFIVPLHAFGYLLLIICLLLPRHLQVKLRHAAFSLIVVLSTWTLQRCRTLGLAYGLMIGISCSWCILLSANLLFLHSPLEHCQRKIERPQAVSGSEGSKKDEVHGQWQRRPASIYERLFWTLDLLGSLRDLHWSTTRNESRKPDQKHENGKHSMSFLTTLVTLIATCLGLDCLKEIIAIDPYFWGYIDAYPPQHIKSFLRLPVLIKAYRMLIAFAVFYLSIHMICAAGRLVFVHALGPRVAGIWGHSWAHKRPFGSISSVNEHGLRGFWGKWWHQFFRIQFTAPANAVIHTLNIREESLFARVCRLFIPFLFSGFIHACGSYTLSGETKPVNSFLFFALQPIGIALQSVVGVRLSMISPFNKLSPRMIRLCRFMFTVVWLLETFSLMVEDYSKGGFWLTEPFPFSMIQALGVGSQARRHQLWHGCGSSLSMGPDWWRMGLSL